MQLKTNRRSFIKSSASLAALSTLEASSLIEPNNKLINKSEYFFVNGDYWDDNQKLIPAVYDDDNLHGKHFDEQQDALEAIKRHNEGWDSDISVMYTVWFRCNGKFYLVGELMYAESGLDMFGRQWVCNKEDLDDLRAKAYRNI